jgi:hypothetical protein
MWVLTPFHSENHGGGVSVLKRLPELTMEELIEIAITSNNPNDIVGASIIGKHFTEIEADAKYYATISQQAKAILAGIDKYSC